MNRFSEKDWKLADAWDNLIRVRDMNVAEELVVMAFGENILGKKIEKKIGKKIKIILGSIVQI